MIRTISITVLTFAVALVLSGPVFAVVYFEENFDSLTDGNLAGQTSNGQTWQTGTLWAAVPTRHVSSISSRVTKRSSSGTTQQL